jgi:uncharacterized protein (DUF433 family)
MLINLPYHCTMPLYSQQTLCDLLRIPIAAFTNYTEMRLIPDLPDYSFGHLIDLHFLFVMERYLLDLGTVKDEYLKLKSNAIGGHPFMFKALQGEFLEVCQETYFEKIKKSFDTMQRYLDYTLNGLVYNWHTTDKQVIINPNINHGAPCIKNIPVLMIRDYIVSEKVSTNEAAMFFSLTTGQVKRAIKFISSGV